MGLHRPSNRWRLSDALWAKLQPLLPVPEDHHPLGCHRKRVPDRDAMDAILFVLRTGCQWNALNATVFEGFWRQGLLAYDELVGIDWSWLSMDGAMTKAPLGGEKNGAKSHRPCEDGHETQCFDGWWRHSTRCRDRRSQRAGLQAGA